RNKPHFSLVTSVKTERSRHCRMHDLPVTDIESGSKMLVLIEGCQSFARERDHERQRGVVERLRRRDGNRAGHVRNAIMNDAVDLVGRIGVCRWPRGLEATALIDRHVDEYSAALHVLEHLAADEF